MQKANWKDITDLVGIATIVASLIFVGLELRQSQKITIASQYQARVSFNIDYFQNLRDQGLRRAGEREKQWIVRLDLQPAVKESLLGMSPLELGGLVNEIDQIIFIFDNAHYQYQAGFIDDESWLTMRTRTGGYLRNNELARQRLLSRTDRYRVSLIEEVNRMLEEVE